MAEAIAAQKTAVQDCSKDPVKDAPGDSSKVRIYITDSNSWQMSGSSGGSNGNYGGSSAGGARP